MFVLINEIEMIQLFANNAFINRNNNCLGGYLHRLN